MESTAEMWLKHLDIWSIKQQMKVSQLDVHLIQSAVQFTLVKSESTGPIFVQALDPCTAKAPKRWGQEGKMWAQQQLFGLCNVRPMRSFRPKSWSIEFIASSLQ